MDTLLELVGKVASELAVVPFFWLVAVALFVFAATKNFRRFRAEESPALWPADEVALGQFDVDRILIRIRTVLSSRRIVQTRLGWFLSKRKIKNIAWEDVTAITFRRSMNWPLLLLGVYFIGSINSVALFLVLVGIQARVYSVVLRTPFAQMPFMQMVVKTVRRAQLKDIVPFYLQCQLIWSRVRIERGLPLAGDQVRTPRAVGVPLAETDFAWGRPVLVAVAGLIVLGWFQHQLEGHVSFDDYWFGPIYLGWPIAAACRSGRDGAWIAVLGVIALVAVKFPSGGLWSFLSADGAFPYWTQYALVCLGLLVMVTAAQALTRVSNVVVGCLAIILWLPVAAAYTPAAAWDLALYAKIAGAVGAAIALTRLDAALASRSVTVAA